MSTKLELVLYSHTPGSQDFAQQELRDQLWAKKRLLPLDTRGVTFVDDHHEDISLHAMLYYSDNAEELAYQYASHLEDSFSSTFHNQHFTDLEKNVWEMIQNGVAKGIISGYGWSSAC